MKTSTKKPTEKQLAARRKFAAASKNGTLLKQRKAAAPKKKTGLNKPGTKGLTTLCAKSIGTTGRRKKDGTIKKGYVATKGGRVVSTKKKR